MWQLQFHVSKGSQLKCLICVSATSAFGAHELKGLTERRMNGYGSGLAAAGCGGDGALVRQRQRGCNSVVSAWGSPVLHVSGHNATERARSTSTWNRKATGSYDGVTPTLVYMDFA